MFIYMKKIYRNREGWGGRSGGPHRDNRVVIYVYLYEEFVLCLFISKYIDSRK